MLDARRKGPHASLAQLVEHALRKRMVVGSIPTGGYLWINCASFCYFGEQRARECPGRQVALFECVP